MEKSRYSRPLVQVCENASFAGGEKHWAVETSLKGEKGGPFFFEIYAMWGGMEDDNILWLQLLLLFEKLWRHPSTFKGLTYRRDTKSFFFSTPQRARVVTSWPTKGLMQQ